MSWGWLGVDAFFVISGYLTARQLGDGRRADVWLFRRWARLHPALLALAVAVGPIAYLGGTSFQELLGYGAFLYSPWFVGGDGGLFGHTWSITVEVAAYLVAALVLPTVLRGRRSVVAGILLIAALASLVAPWDAVRLVRPEGILLGWAIGALHIPGTGARQSVLARVLGSRAMTFVGARTYSLYLRHLPIFLLLRFQTGLSGSLLIVIQFTAAFVCAEASFRWVETPSRRWLYAWGSRRFGKTSTNVRGRPEDQVAAHVP